MVNNASVTEPENSVCTALVWDKVMSFKMFPNCAGICRLNEYMISAIIRTLKGAVSIGILCFMGFFEKAVLEQRVQSST